MGVSLFVQRQKSNLSDPFVSGHRISRLVGFLVFVVTVSIQT